MRTEILEFIANSLAIPVDDIDEPNTLRNDLNLDSLTIVNLIGDIEDEYGVVVEENDINGIITVADLIDYIEENA